MTKPLPKTQPTPAERGQRLVEVMDATVARLLKELQSGEIKPALIAASLDLLRWAGLDARSYATLPPTKHYIRNLPDFSADGSILNLTTESNREYRKLPVFPPIDPADKFVRNEIERPFKP